MKQKIAIFLATMFLLSVSLSASEKRSITLDYSQLKGSKDLTVRINTSSIAYSLKLRQYNSGEFALQSQPFLVAQIEDTLHVGELKDANLLSLMLSPMTANPTKLGFVHNSNFLHITSPSQSPSLSGIALTLEHMDLIILNPIMNPKTPLGQGLIAGTKRIFSGVLHATRASRSIQRETDDYTIDWHQSGLGKNMLFSLFGACSSSEDLSSMIFLQNAWDPAFGGGTVLGYRICLESDNLALELDRRLGSNEISLQQASSSSLPVEIFRLKFSMGKENSLGLEYLSRSYPSPIFGGQSQKREICLAVSGSIGGLSLLADNLIVYDIDFGKLETTDYELRYDSDSSYLLAGFKLNRNINDKCTATGGYLKAKVPKATLVLMEKKAELEFHWKFQLNEGTLTLSVNQDRCVSASLSIKGI